LLPGSLKTQLAAIARQTVEQHEEWDRPHSFEILCRDDEGIVPRLYVCIMTDIPPAQYPTVMHKAATEWLTDHPGEPPYAFLLASEGYAAEEPGPDAPPGERERYWAAARTPCGFADLPYVREEFAAWVVDVHGRGWRAGHYRDDPGVISEKYHPPGTLPSTVMLRGLLQVAYATGMAAYDLPGPQGTWN
jgi:hypothetical protein